MGETIEKVKGRQGILSKIQNFFTLDYGTKEDLRKLDNKLRGKYYDELRQMRYDWEGIYYKILDDNIKVSNRDLKKVLQVLDRVVEKIHHADYGYAGLYDRKGHIREEGLIRVLDYDMTMEVHINNLKEAVIKIQSYVENENYTEFTKELKKIKDLLLSFEDKWNERKEQFRL